MLQLFLRLLLLFQEELLLLVALFSVAFLFVRVERWRGVIVAVATGDGRG